MDATDQITDPHIDSEGGDAADRAAALRARIRELRRVASEESSRQPSGKAADTQLSSTTQVEDNRIASLARQVNRSASDAIPPLHTAQVAVRWRYPSCPPPDVRDSREGAARAAIKGLVKTTPVWLLSAIVHIILLVTLALLTYKQTTEAAPIIIAGNRAEPDVLPEVPDDIEIGDPRNAPDESSWNDMDAAPLEPMDLKLPNELTPPDFSVSLSGLTARSEQLDAALKIEGGGRLQPRKNASGAQFYGIQAQGNRFVFIVDSSTSMRVSKFAEACRELEKAVRGLGEDRLFYVIFFDRHAKRMRMGEWNEKGTRYTLNRTHEPNLISPTSENIDGLIYWMNTIQLDSDTNPYPAVVYALRKLQPDAIFLLSDGEFNDGGSTESFLLRENIVDDPTEGPTPQTIIHCVGFYSRQGEITLKRIADTHGGTYRFVERPSGLIIRPVFGRRMPVR